MSQSYAPVRNYSKLESITNGNIAYSASVPQDYTLFNSPVIGVTYTESSVLSQTYQHNDPLYNLFTPQVEYHFTPDHFLKPGKKSIFVGKAVEIKDYIEETFEKMFQKPFPTNIKINICNENTFRKIAPSPGTIGVSFNRNKYGLLSEIFVLNDYLARVMLTLGHELGHVLTETLNNAHNEEAKAYAFSLAWMEIIKEHNIAGLGDAIIFENPADNGLHNVAFSFVKKLILQGEMAWEIYLKLINHNLF